MLCFLSALALVRLENGVVFVLSLFVSKDAAGTCKSETKNSFETKESSVVRGMYLSIARNATKVVLILCALSRQSRNGSRIFRRFGCTDYLPSVRAL